QNLHALRGAAQCALPLHQLQASLCGQHGLQVRGLRHPVHLLHQPPHSKHIIEQTYISRRVLAQAIAEQYFGCFISMQTTADAWLTRGISGFLAYDYYKKSFGNNEYRYYVKRSMDKVIKYEQQFRPIVLDP